MSRSLVALVYDRKVGSVHRKAVLAYFADRASDNGKGIWASKRTIAEETECGRSTVIKIIADFIDEGIVIVAGEKPCRNGKTIVYDLNVAAIHALPKAGNQSTSGTSPDLDPSTSGTPPVHQRDPMGSTSGTQTVLEPSMNKSADALFGQSPEKPPPKQRRAVSLPPDWVPSDRNIADAHSLQFSEKEITHEADQFRDYHRSRGNTFKDWDAAWRTWLRNCRKFQGRGMAGTPRTFGRGQGSSLASVVARRRAAGEV